MKVFIAGATGAVGRRLVPLLLTHGHQVVAMTRSAEKARALEELGAQPVVADGLERTAVMQAVLRAEPEAIVHVMTALDGVTSVKRFDHEFALTNRLRTVGLDYLLEGARAAGTRRFVAESFGNWNYARTGGPVKSEEDPLDPTPPSAMRESLAAIRHLERAVTGDGRVEGLALRYANLYGPGTSTAADGYIVEQVRKRRFPVVGDGGGVWSFIHVDDAAEATRLALERGDPGVYNVADDEPAPAATWLPALAETLGAKSPRRVPTWVGRLAVGEPGVSMFTRIRGAASTKARCELGWEMRYPSWREGFRHGLADEADARVIAGG